MMMETERPLMTTEPVSVEDDTENVIQAELNLQKDLGTKLVKKRSFKRKR